jgi:hypothetical protein
LLLGPEKSFGVRFRIPNLEPNRSHHIRKAGQSLPARDTSDKTKVLRAVQIETAERNDRMPKRESRI